MSNNHNSKSNNFVYNNNDISDVKQNNENDDIDEYFCLLINMIDEIKGNDNTDFLNEKLSQYLEMMQNIIDNYYNLCIEKL